MTAADILDTLRARGVELVVAGDRLRWRPREALTPDEVEQLRACKPEVLQALAPAPIRPPALAVKTVVEVLGPRPTPGQVTALGVAVAEALAQLREEVETGQLQGVPLLIAGRPLADYLGLDQLAEILTTWRPRPCGRKGAS